MSTKNKREAFSRHGHVVSSLHASWWHQGTPSLRQPCHGALISGNRLPLHSSQLLDTLEKSKGFLSNFSSGSLPFKLACLVSTFPGLQARKGWCYNPPTAEPLTNLPHVCFASDSTLPYHLHRTVCALLPTCYSYSPELSWSFPNHWLL